MSKLSLIMGNIAGNLVLNSIPFQYHVGTDAHNEDRIDIFNYSIYVLDNGEICMNDAYDTFYFDEVRDLIKSLKLGIEENLWS